MFQIYFWHSGSFHQFDLALKRSPPIACSYWLTNSTAADTAGTAVSNLMTNKPQTQADSRAQCKALALLGPCYAKYSYCFPTLRLKLLHYCMIPVLSLTKGPGSLAKNYLVPHLRCLGSPYRNCSIHGGHNNATVWPAL